MGSTMRLEGERFDFKIEDGDEVSSLVEGQKLTRRRALFGVQTASSEDLEVPGDPGERWSGVTGVPVASSDRLSSNDEDVWTLELFAPRLFFVGLKLASEAKANAEASSDEFTLSLETSAVANSGLSTFRFLDCPVGTLESSRVLFSISAGWILLIFANSVRDLCSGPRCSIVKP